MVIKMLAGSLLFAAFSLAVDGGHVELVKSGKSDYSIVLPDTSIEAERTAATELRKHLRLISGVELGSEGGKRILLGDSQEIRSLLSDVDWSSLDSDELIIRTVGDALILSGGRPRGTLYAVYTFLEDVLGCRWWSPTESYIPSHRDIVLDNLNIRYKPVLKYRYHRYGRMREYPEFTARSKINGGYATAKFGGDYTILGSVHTFNKLLPPEKYFAQHPEWYSEVNGKRISERSQLCLTNKEMRAELVANALKWIANRPDAEMISISQNDWKNFCTCEKCRAIDKREGSPSGSLIDCINAVAEEIGKHYPKILVETLAYDYTEKPPRTLKPGKNVVIRLCSITADGIRPFSDPANAEFNDYINKWSEIASGLMIWDYVTNFRNHLMPWPNIQILGQNINYFIRHKAFGIYEQGDLSTRIGHFLAMKTWITGHLLWKPDTDESRLQKEFLSGYYGDAAPFLEEYLERIRSSALRTKRKFNCVDPGIVYCDWLSVKDITDCWSLFDKALAAVKDNPALYERVRRERTSLISAILNRWQLTAMEEAKTGSRLASAKLPKVTELLSELMEVSEKYQNRNFAEGRDFSTRYNPTVYDGKLPERLTKRERSDWLVFQEAEMMPWRPGEHPLVNDPLASNHRAILYSGDRYGWGIMFFVPGSMADGNRWRCFISLRCEPNDKCTDDNEAVVKMGLYYYDSNKTVLERIVKLGEVKNGGYQEIEMGDFELRPNATAAIWFSSCNKDKKRPGNLKNFYIDRVYFEREKAKEL